jgi:hypothetical protein
VYFFAGRNILDLKTVQSRLDFLFFSTSGGLADNLKRRKKEERKKAKGKEEQREKGKEN